MGMKYSINSDGRIVAERDIYSLGGFIPKGRLGCKIASEEQLSQDGECWVAGGDISNRPDVRIKDNAYIGDFISVAGYHSDGVTVFSGNTKIPGAITVRNPIADPVNNAFIKDSFIGIKMDVVCGASTNTKAFPFEIGSFNNDSPKGTLFNAMGAGSGNMSRTSAVLRCGRDTQIYIPTGYNCRVMWGYFNEQNQLAFSGESFAVSTAITKLEHPVYNLCMLHIAKADGTALTPAGLETSGARIIGHYSGSLLTDIRPESASGSYVMDGSSFIATTDNFGLSTVQLRFLAGGLINSNMYINADRAEYKPYGTFRNVEHLEYTMYLGDAHRTNVNRDKYISAYDCPLLRVDGTTYNTSLINKGNLTLRRCIVPKAIFTDNIHNGNVYEDIDFSYANEFLGAKAGNNFDMWSSHVQGMYAGIGAGVYIAGLISRPENLAAGSVLGPDGIYHQLDGNIIEQGSYTSGKGALYENNKIDNAKRVRIKRPLSTQFLSLIGLPSEYYISGAFYLDENLMVLTDALSVPNNIFSNDYPYVVFNIKKADDSDITPSDVTKLSARLRFYDYTRIPIVSGSAYVGAGVTVRGDVQVIGQPYVDRVYDRNLWEQGGVTSSLVKDGWEQAKNAPGSSTENDRLRLKELIPVKPGSVVTCADGFNIIGYFYAEDGSYIMARDWGVTTTAPDNAAYIGIILRKGTGSNTPISLSDLESAHVRYVESFRRLRYITNELDRKDPSDILLSPDYWEQGSMASGEAHAGKTYNEIKTAYTKAIRLKTPINVYMPGQTTSQGAGFNVSKQVFDAATKLYAPVSDTVYAKTALITLVTVKKDASEVPPSEAPDSRVYVEYVPTPRIVVPYGSATLNINGVKIRMYDNSVLSRNFNQDGEVVLQGNAVMGYNFDSGSCICSNGHDDAIIKLP